MAISEYRESSPSDLPAKYEASEHISQAEEGTGEVHGRNVELRRDLKARHITMIGMSSCVILWLG